MTSVTVAGGSFDVPRRRRRLARPTVSARQERWLKYGAGVSIAGLLAANGFALSSMLGDAARDLLGDGAAGTAAPATAPAVAVEGDGFAAFEVPTDLESYYRSLHGVAAAGAGAVAEAAPAPSLPAAHVELAPPVPAPAPTPTDQPAASPPPTAASDTTVVEQVVAVVEEVPVVGAPLAEVADEVVATTEPVVDQAVDTVTEPAPEPVGDAVESTVDDLI